MRHNTFTDLNVVSIMVTIAGLSPRLLYSEQQQRSSVHQDALSLINHGDASDSEDIDEWDWRSMSEKDNQDDNEYCITSDDDVLLTHLLQL